MDMVEADSNSCLMHGVFLIYTIPFGITYQKAFRSSPVNPGKCLEETSYTVVTFSSSQNILQSHQINLPSHPPLSGQLLGGSCLPSLCEPCYFSFHRQAPTDLSLDFSDSFCHFHSLRAACLVYKFSHLVLKASHIFTCLLFLHLLSC